MNLTKSGYSAHDGGYSGTFGWTTHASHPGRWLVTFYGSAFAKASVSFAVTDDFGNLVRVAGGVK